MNRRFSRLDLLAFSLILIFTVKSIIIFALSNPLDLVLYHSDDAYYYYEIAHNAVTNNIISYDNIHITNGFHPLWLLVLMPLFEFFTDKLFVLRAIGTFTTILLATSLIFSYLYLKSNHNQISTAISLFLFSIFTLLYVRVNMEVSILLPLATFLFYYSDKVDLWHLSTSDNKSVLISGVLMSLVMLSRLDAVLLVLTFSLYILLRNTGDLKTWLLLNAPCIGAGSLYLYLNYSYFEHFVPVSSKAKSLTAPINYDLINQLVAKNGVALNFTKFILLTSIIYTICYLLYEYDFISTPIKPLTRPGKVMIIFSTVYLIYYLMFSSFFWYSWYFYPMALLTVYLIPTATDWALPTKIKETRVDYIVTIVLLLAITASLSVGTVVLQPNGFQDSSYQRAQEANQEFSQGTVLAHGDGAGAFGYFSDHNVVQTECLVGNYECIAALENNRLYEYLKSSEVDYLFGADTNGVYSPTERPGMRNVEMEVCERAHANISLQTWKGSIWSVEELSKCQ